MKCALVFALGLLVSVITSITSKNFKKTNKTAAAIDADADLETTMSTDPTTATITTVDKTSTDLSDSTITFSTGSDPTTGVSSEHSTVGFTKGGNHTTTDQDQHPHPSGEESTLLIKSRFSCLLMASVFISIVSSATIVIV